jgi:hypothetical protein
MTIGDSKAIRESFRAQGDLCRALGSPFTGALCDLIAERLRGESRFGRRILEWTGDPRNDVLALRAAGAFHALARSGSVPALTAAYPPAALDHSRLWIGIAAAVAGQDDWLFAYLDSPPQTNEVARSAILLGGCLTIARVTGLPLALYEIGSSAGLNLIFDRYQYDLGQGSWGSATSPVVIACDWQGDVPPLDTPLTIASRAGVDLRPLDPALPADRGRLLSYIWPDQAQRLARTAAALDLAAARPWHVSIGDAADWVAAELDRMPQPGVTRVLMHTIVWQYLPKPSRARIRAALKSAGALARADAPLAWLKMEYAGDWAAAGVSLTLWPDGEEVRLGTADYHGRWARWEKPASFAA